MFDELLTVQRILGVEEDGDYGPKTTAAMVAWQARHLPDLPEVHRGYLTRHFWDKARDLGLLEPAQAEAPPTEP